MNKPVYAYIYVCVCMYFYMYVCLHYLKIARDYCGKNFLTQRHSKRGGSLLLRKCRLFIKNLSLYIFM